MSRSQNPVLTACLAHVRAPSRGVWLAEPGVAPAVWDLAIPAPGRLGWPSGPTTRVCLQWLDAGRNESGGSRMDTWGLEPPVRPRKHGSEVKNRHSGAPGGERADRKARGAFARCQMLPSAFRRSAPSHCEGREVLGEGREMTADPEARLRASSPRYGRTNNGDDESRLYECAV